MKRKIKNELNNKIQFLAGISHDLGTLVTRIILQLEIAIQEAIIFNNRYQELVSHGIDPLVLVKQKDGEEMPPPVTKSQALTLGVSTCTKCGATLDPDLDFCPACGEIQK